MEKTIFLFRRKEGSSRADFQVHYITSHAPLGKRLTRCLLGYQVNLTEDVESPDSVTEHWVPSAMCLLTPSIAYDNMEDFEEVWADDQSFIGGFDLYVVDREIPIAEGEPLDTPLEQETPEPKVVWFLPADHAQLPPEGARRVIDNRVAKKIVYSQEGKPQELPSDVAVIRMAWGKDIDITAAQASGGIRVREYRFISAPAW